MLRPCFGATNGNPSTTPTIGLSAYQARQRSGTMLAGYAMGVARNQNSTRKFSVYRTSRYFTLSAERHRPMPKEAITASNTTKGSKMTTIAEGVIRK